LNANIINFCPGGNAFENLIEFRWLRWGRQIGADTANNVVAVKELGKREKRTTDGWVVHVAVATDPFRNAFKCFLYRRIRPSRFFSAASGKCQRDKAYVVETKRKA